MIPAATGVQRAPSPRSDFEAQLARYRDPVTALILRSLPDREPKKHLYDIVASQLSREGKGIRPALCLATCAAFGGDREQALPAAAAIELLHNAFLVHDDVEDRSEYRRDRPTMHRLHGVPLAINAGDAMNALSVRMLRSGFAMMNAELAARLYDEFDHMSLETIEGQAMELGWIHDNECGTTEDDYLLMVLKKTSWYSFIHPARIGALIAQPERSDLDAFSRFGYYLGTAFQIQDDVLNLTGDRSKYGKEIGGDLLEGKRTLMLAHLFQNGTSGDKERLKAFLAKPRAQRLPREIAWIHELLRTYGSIDYARRAAREFAEGARRELDCAYAGAIPGDDLTFVRSLLDYLIQREA